MLAGNQLRRQKGDGDSDQLNPEKATAIFTG